ncbi:MAG: metallophosphoesterase [Gammaproteobacteria bacterium]|nr:metallophosphoesterase [Gammaproteobacteria bacterium]
MKLLQMTDIHLTPPGKTIGGRDPNENFKRALSHAMDFHSDAEGLFLTGDLSDWGETDDYERLKMIIADIKMPVHLCIGNHDDRKTFLNSFPEWEGEDGFVQHVIKLSAGNAITLDTWGEATHAGHFCDLRADWLAKQLTDLPGPIWVFMHHNPVATRIKPMDQIMLLDSQRFKQTIAPHKDKIAHLFHGHCHLPLSGNIAGVSFSAPRGTNHAGWPDFSAERLLSASDLPESYSVIYAEADSTMCAMVEYGYSGEIRSEGSPEYENWDQATMIR